MNGKLLTEHSLEFLNLKGGCIGSYESTHVKISSLLGKNMSLQKHCVLGPSESD